jgi:fido (protein-threonine AMPylation protein)
LDRAEADISYTVIYTLVQGSRVNRLVFDTRLVSEIHKEIFRDIYTWAGEFRKEVTSKGGSTFTHPDNIGPQLDEITSSMESDGRLSGKRALSVDAITVYYDLLNFVHPFREGNGRAIRTFLSLLAKKYGYVIAWDKMDKAENIRVCEWAMFRDTVPMRQMIDGLVAP